MNSGNDRLVSSLYIMYISIISAHGKLTLTSKEVHEYDYLPGQGNNGMSNWYMTNDRKNSKQVVPIAYWINLAWKMDEIELIH